MAAAAAAAAAAVGMGPGADVRGRVAERGSGVSTSSRDSAGAPAGQQLQQHPQQPQQQGELLQQQRHQAHQGEAPGVALGGVPGLLRNQGEEGPSHESFSPASEMGSMLPHVGGQGGSRVASDPADGGEPRPPSPRQILPPMLRSYIEEEEDGAEGDQGMRRQGLQTSQQQDPPTVVIRSRYVPIQSVPQGIGMGRSDMMTLIQILKSIAEVVLPRSSIHR